MAGYNMAILIGNVGREPELRYLDSGVAVCDFSLAATKRFNNAAGEPVEKTEWFRITAWRGLAETVNTHVHKGMQLFVVGEITSSAYIAQDGTARSSNEITARDIQFLGKRTDQNGNETIVPEEIPFD